MLLEVESSSLGSLLNEAVVFREKFFDERQLSYVRSRQSPPESVRILELEICCTVQQPSKRYRTIADAGVVIRDVKK